MKKYGIATSVAVLMVLALTYLLHPLNSGAVGILSLICIGACNGLAAAISGKRNEDK